MTIAERHNIRILVVDDILDTRDYISKMLLLERELSVVGMASNGLEALELAERLLPDIVLMDVNMPVMDGFKATEQIIARLPQIGIIIMSVQAETDYIRRAMLAGAREFLIKPLRTHDLLSSIRHVYRLSNQQRRTESEHIFREIALTIPKSELSLITVQIENDSLDMYRLLDDGVIKIPGNQRVIVIDHTALLAFVPSDIIDKSVDFMLDHFYDHEMIFEMSDVYLCFGISNGKHASADKVVEYAALDLVERRDSQGVNSGTLPAILSIQPRRLELQRRYERATEHRNRLEMMKRQSLASISGQIRVEIDELTAIVNHDLRSGLNAIWDNVKRLLGKYSERNESTDERLYWIYRQIVLCNAWHYSLMSLGAQKPLQMSTVHLFDWLQDNLTILGRQLELELEINVLFLSAEMTSVDTHLLLPACLHLLLAAHDAKATFLRVDGSMPSSDYLHVVFRDNGVAHQRINNLSTKFLATDVPLYFASLPSLLGQQHIHVECQEVGGLFEMKWIILLKTPKRTNIKPIEQLNQEVNTLENRNSLLESQVQRNFDMSAEQVMRRAQHLLRPYSQELEENVQKLVLRSSAAPKFGRIDLGSEQRIANIARYCLLLVRNLTLTLQGERLTAEVVNLNDEVRQVLSLLGHKLSEHDITIDLAEQSPMVLIASLDLKQILMNILKNAAESTRPGNSIQIRTFTTQKNERNLVVIQIKDTGSGIPNTNRDKIFQVNFSTKGRGKNWGVGLFAVQELVRNAGGQIKVTSAITDNSGRVASWAMNFDEDPGIVWDRPGTLFHIELPLAKDG